MAAITPNAFSMQDATLTIGADEFAAGVSSVALIPDTGVSWFKGLRKGTAIPFNNAMDWHIDITAAQDVSSTSALSLLLLAQEGQAKSVTFRPRTGTGFSGFTANVILVPGQFGGDIDGPATFQVSLPVNGTITPIA